MANRFITVTELARDIERMALANAKKAKLPKKQAQEFATAVRILLVGDR